MGNLGMINHPAVFVKAREEIELVVGKSRLVEESDVPKLLYIQAILKESLRLHPPIPTIGREASRLVAMMSLQKLVSFVNVWSMGRNSKIWEDPLKFRPERFMPGSHEGHEGSSMTDVRGQHFNLLPFGTGRRVCPGMSLALLQVPTVLAVLIQCFDFKVVGNGEGAAINMDERLGLTASRAHPLMLLPVVHYNPIPTETPSILFKPSYVVTQV